MLYLSALCLQFDELLLAVEPGHDLLHLLSELGELPRHSGYVLVLRHRTILRTSGSLGCRRGRLRDAARHSNVQAPRLERLGGTSPFVSASEIVVRPTLPARNTSTTDEPTFASETCAVRWRRMVRAMARDPNARGA